MFVRKSGKGLKQQSVLWAILIALIVLSSCGGDEPETTAVPPTSTAPATEAAPPTATISPLSAAESPLNAPASPLAAPASQKSGDATTGGVTGQIVVHTKDGTKPVSEMILALAAVIRDDKGIAKVAGYDAANAPSTLTDTEGKFQVDDVAPGTYALILDAVLKSHMLTYPGTEETILIDVKAGEVVSTSLLEYDGLPLPGFSAE